MEDALYVAGTVCATCFFLPEVLYLVRYEMGLWIKNAYLHVGQKQCLIEMSKWRNIFSREIVFCKGMLPMEKNDENIIFAWGMLHPLNESVCL